MANPSTATPNAASTVVDEAVRIANEGSRRTTENAQAALAFGRRYLDQTSQLNRDLFAVWTASVEAGFQTAFDIQNAALASSQSAFETSFSLSKDALRRWADVTRQVQATTLKAYQSNARLLESLASE
jgi:hypothetical protein